jgi:hypothetical protein
MWFEIWSRILHFNSKSQNSKSHKWMSKIKKKKWFRFQIMQHGGFVQQSILDYEKSKTWFFKRKYRKFQMSMSKIKKKNGLDFKLCNMVVLFNRAFWIMKNQKHGFLKKIQKVSNVDVINKKKKYFRFQIMQDGVLFERALGIMKNQKHGFLNKIQK